MQTITAKAVFLFNKQGLCSKLGGAGRNREACRAPANDPDVIVEVCHEFILQKYSLYIKRVINEKFGIKVLELFRNKCLCILDSLVINNRTKRL